MPTMAPASSASTPRVTLAETEVVSAALARARQGDVAGALRALEPLRESAERARAGLQVVAMLAQEEPRAAAALAAGLPSRPAQLAGMESAARVMVARDPEAAVRWSLGEAYAAGELARSAVANVLVADNPRAAIERITAQPVTPARDDLLALAAAAWARSDADAAVAWLRSLPDDERQPRLTSSVGFALAQTRPDRAVAVADMLPAGRNRWLLLSSIGQTWVAVDTKAALTWAGRLPAGEPRDSAFAGIDTGLGVPVSRRVAGAPGTRGTSNRTRGGGAPDTAAWSEISSPEFAAWLATQAPGMTRDEAILEYVRQRGTLSPGTLGSWITTLPGGPTRDRAMEIFVDGLLIGSPTQAAEWLRTLPRSDRSDVMIERTAREWFRRNPEAAAAWLESTSLPPERKEQLLREAGR